MSKEQDPDQERLLELFDNEEPVDQEPAELTLARLEWYMKQDNLALLVFLERLGVDKGMILATLQFVQDCNNDYLESLGFTLEDHLPDPREPMRHPEMDEIEQGIGRYAMTDTQFTFSDFAALEGNDVQSTDLEALPQFVRDIMDGQADRLMSGSDYTLEINEVRVQSVSDAIEELEGPKT